MTSALEVLGLPTGATQDEVRGAWKKLAAVHHPDRGGDPAEFDRYRQAYLTALQDAPEVRAPVLCTSCHGTGKLRVTRGWTSVELPCSRCEGSGTEKGQ